MDMSDV